MMFPISYLVYSESYFTCLLITYLAYSVNYHVYILITTRTNQSEENTADLSTFATRTAQCCNHSYVIGVSLSEPHTSVTSLRTCVCMFACLDRPLTVNFK